MMDSLPSTSAGITTAPAKTPWEGSGEDIQHKEEFEVKIRQMLQQGGPGSRSIFTREKLKKYISEVKIAKLKKSTKTSHEYDLLSRYDVRNMFGEDVLIALNKNEKRRRGTAAAAATNTTTTETSRMYRRLIHEGQLFDTIYDAHSAVSHGGEKRTYFQVNKTIANVTQKEVRLFISLCTICNLKRLPRRKKGVVRPIVSESFGERGQMDLINMQKDGGSPYNYILHYQDHLTKFSILRPLYTKQAIEVARHLLDIFSLIGAPRFLQSDNGREFVAEVIHQLQTELWPDLVLVNSKPRHPQSQGSIERANGDIIQMLSSWMCENKTRDWASGLPFVQYKKNIAFTRGIGLSPYKAVFGIDPQVGMQMQLSAAMYRKLKCQEISEEEFMEIENPENNPDDPDDIEPELKQESITTHNSSSDLEVTIN